VTPYRGILVGCGFFSANHLEGWRSLPDARIVAVCDLDPAKAATQAQRFGVARHGSDLAALIADLQPDFVDIATTVDSHLALLRAAVGPGRLVICQKPMADTLADAQAMLDSAAQVGATLLIHENFRWQRPFRTIPDRIAAGVPGQIAHARFSCRHGYDNYVNQPCLALVDAAYASARTGKRISMASFGEARS